jgi:hypothetical protein
MGVNAEFDARGPVRSGWRRTLPSALFLGAAALMPAQTTAPSRAVRSATPDAWGVALPTYHVIAADELSPRNSSIGVGCIQNCQLRYATSVLPDQFQAPVHLPSGVQIEYMEIDFYDGTATGEVAASLAVCSLFGDDCTAVAGACGGVTVCSGVPDANGFFSMSVYLTGAGIVVDNNQARYLVVANNTTPDGTTAISQIILGYVRLVSPAPVDATFNDVPTSSPLFQYVEALSDSGVTSGCGNGNYCPNMPLTRGQMAVFLAKALGLQWE